MDVNKMLASLRQERGHVDEVIIALERLAAGRQLRRGLVAAWLNGPPKTGRLPVMQRAGAAIKVRRPLADAISQTRKEPHG